jgi:hypothetical protein
MVYLQRKFQSKRTKIYQTKPIFEKPKMNLRPYKTKDYDRNLSLSTMEKQSQNKPNQTQSRYEASPQFLSAEALAKADARLVLPHFTHLVYFNFTSRIAAKTETLSTADFFYFLEAEKPAAINTAALLRSSIPVICVSQIFRPKRPRPALARPNRINYASFLAAVRLRRSGLAVYPL